MTNAELKAEIARADWANYNGPPLYDPARVPLALNALIDLNDLNRANAVGDALLSAVANNHAGVYYPALIKALDFIIAIGAGAEDELRRTCARAVLNDLYYFEPDVTGYSTYTAVELKEIITKKLSPYSDESIDSLLPG